MKIQGSKKTAVIVLVIFVTILLVVLGIVLYSNYAKKYPEEPLKMKNLGVTEENIDISMLSIDNNIKDVPVYFIEPKVHITQVEQIIDRMSLKLERKDIISNSYIEWSDKENTFTYDAVTDSVSFQLTKRITLERGEESFAHAFKKYLDLDYEFKLIKEKRNSDGGITYYGARLLEDVPVQYGAGYEYSDILQFDSQGNLIAGQMLLAEIKKYDIYLPLISRSELDKYINTKEYPKENYTDSSVLVDTLKLDYLNDQWEEIEDTLEGCIAQDSELLFMYKTSNQGYLLPVYKISSNCTVKYEKQEYTVPALFYVNAADPRYITL